MKKAFASLEKEKKGCRDCVSIGDSRHRHSSAAVHIHLKGFNLLTRVQ